ncbi:MAG: hypothetical protein Q4C87_05850 [Actinomycetaceae bacterium]|nr:hypothetical protein [Actinomycetaceae bacterium]
MFTVEPGWASEAKGNATGGVNTLNPVTDWTVSTVCAQHQPLVETYRWPVFVWPEPIIFAG